MKTATIRMKADDVAEILLYDQIGRDAWFGDGIDAKQFREQVKSLKGKTINLRVNSPGGSVIDASAMLAALDEHPGRIEVDVDGVAASAASVVCMAGDVVRVASNGLLMIHDPTCGVMGGSDEMRRMADLLDKVKGQILDAYGRRVTDRDQLAAWMKAETWFTGQEAVDAGLADSVTSPVSVAAFAPHLITARKHFARVPDATAAIEAELARDRAAREAETHKRRVIAAQMGM